MNLTDLRDELATRAHELDRDFAAAAPTMARDVDLKVTATKRRRAAAAGSVATLAVAALTVGGMSSLGRPTPTVPAGSVSSAAVMIGSDGMPSRSVPDGPGDVVKNGLRYRSQVGSDTLAVGAIGDRGQGQFTLLWEPTTTHVSISAECYLPGLSADEARRYLVTVGLQGAAGVYGSTCAPGPAALRDLPAGGDTPGEPGQGWSELKVGKAAGLRVQLVDAKTRKPAAVDGAQLTGAVYELGAQQPIEDAAGTTVAALPTVVEHQGYRYHVAGVAQGPLASGALPEVGVPTSVYSSVTVPEGPFLVTWGSAGNDLVDTAQSGDGAAGLRLDGLKATVPHEP